MILRGSELDRGFAVAQRKERCLFAEQAFLDHDFPGRRAEATAEHHVDRGFRLLHALRDDNAFAGGKPVRLYDDRRARLAHIVLGGPLRF